jgi:hypothetical protein
VQCLEVEVAEPLLPMPGVVALPHGEADQLHGLEVEDV